MTFKDHLLQFCVKISTDLISFGEITAKKKMK